MGPVCSRMTGSGTGEVGFGQGSVGGAKPSQRLCGRCYLGHSGLVLKHWVCGSPTMGPEVGLAADPAPSPEFTGMPPDKGAACGPCLQTVVTG